MTDAGQDLDRVIWQRCCERVDCPRRTRIDYLIGEPNLVGQGIGSAAIEAFSATVFDRYPDVDTIVVTPQAANRASCRVLEKAGYRVAWTGMLDSDDPADAGPAALYVLSRA